MSLAELGQGLKRQLLIAGWSLLSACSEDSHLEGIGGDRVQSMLVYITSGLSCRIVPSLIQTSFSVGKHMMYEVAGLMCQLV